MTDKQRADHAQAKYWNGFLTRVEAQKVFEEMSGVIQAQAAAMAKFDVAISCIAEKVGVSPADVNAWLEAKTNAAANSDTNNAELQGQREQSEPKRIVEA